MGITFTVDEVDAVTAPLPRRPAHEAFTQHTGAQLYALSHEPELVGDPGADGTFGIENPLVAAVHRAFSEHRPLRLTPDDVWLTLSQGFAFHVDLHAEALRERFVRHEGRARVEVRVDHAPFSTGGWARVIEQFGEGIREHVGPGVHRMLVSDFSTTTPIAKTASEVVMMSAFKRYFDYRLVCICGIPAVTLEGTPEDWRAIRARVDALGEYELAWWTERLGPIVDELVKTAEGAPDLDFWQCIYMPSETYGAELATGWLARLFPYLKDAAGQVRRQNPAVLEDFNPRADEGAPAFLRRNKKAEPSPERARWLNNGVAIHNFPYGVSEAPFSLVELNDDGSETRRAMRLFGGFIGVTQDDAGVIAPEIGWALGAPTPMSAVLDALEGDAHITRQAEPLDLRGEYPGPLLQLYDRFAEVTVFGRARVRPENELYTVVAPRSGFQGVPVAPFTEGYVPGEVLVLTALVELRGDPRWIGLAPDFSCALVDPRVAQSAEEIPIVADDVTSLLEGLLASEETLFFDAPDFVPRGTLYDRLGHSDIWRAALSPGHDAPADLNQRESEHIVLQLWFKNGSREERNHWWAALKATHDLDDSYRKVIEKKKREAPWAVLQELGLK